MGLSLVALALAIAFLPVSVGAQFRPKIPRIWSAADIDRFEIPVSNPKYSPKHPRPEYYYKIPVRKIYRTYPVYAPGRGPAAYLDHLKRLEPEVTFDASKLKTEQDWIRAGELVFDSPTLFDGPVAGHEEIANPDWYTKAGVQVLPNGVMPYARYVIREKGKVELGNLACAFCHTRVLDDGSVVKGGQGNFPFDRSITFWEGRQLSPQQISQAFLQLFTVPWLPVRQQRMEAMNAGEIHVAYSTVPPGVLGRNRSSIFHPPAVPDLFGLRDRKYLDKSGLVVNRGIADIMRYSAMAEGIDFLSDYGGFVPFGEDFKRLPPPETFSRFSEEQLYALALYLYSLTPPPNPNRMDNAAKQGQRVFERQGCPVCHPAPLYSINKLTPAGDFPVPAGHPAKYDVLDVRVGTDPVLALETRRGTGYYKVPSLRNIWARGPLEHNGSVATLEDWFDPRRLRDDYVPTGFVGFGVKSRAVKGHTFGLNLPAADKKALIAFLRTL